MIVLFLIKFFLINSKHFGFLPKLSYVFSCLIPSNLFKINQKKIVIIYNGGLCFINVR